MVTVRDVSSVDWADVERVFGTRGDPAGCWCQFYKVSNKEMLDMGSAGCSSRLRQQVLATSRTTPSPGLVAYLDDEPVGWIAVEPRTSYPTALRGKVVSAGSTEDPEDATVWAVVCFVVRVGFRRRGIGANLLESAVLHARDKGARLLEGYPVDVGARTKVSSAELYHGTLSIFVRAGFEVVSQPAPGRAVVSLRL
ncbi:MAG: family N-acetyltransferase [Glaciihabitans sp.]|jgi:GNAT superfamily N-acetyltransferase|nr:family N-acetyltransferase [Glaciihabitans sp.]